ncbi:hypothetical protein [Natronosalvus vescus]|uniref:hypothetical protein n=1 Tax=Natronosalvus vescus TaxID=2953881 RepID=UPI00209157A2|nr:hypothetical protein [Natronosalvus vescus]
MKRNIEPSANVSRRTVLRKGAAGAVVVGVTAIIGGTAAGQQGQGQGGVAETDEETFRRKEPWVVTNALEPIEEFVSCMAEQSADRVLYEYDAEYVDDGTELWVLTRKPLTVEETYQFNAPFTQCKDTDAVQTSFRRVR